MELADFGVTRKVAKLSNGARLVVFERPGMPVSLRAAFHSGGRYDPVGSEGLAHFAEHMLVAGTERFPTKDRLATYIEQYGGVFGAQTSTEMMNVNISLGDPNDFDKAVEILNEMLLKSRYDPKTFETERGSILREFAIKQSNPQAWLTEVWHRLYFQDTPVGRSVIGSEDTIGNISLEQVKAYFDSYLRADRLALVVAGGINLDQARKQLEGDLELVSSPVDKRVVQDLPIIRVSKIGIQSYEINDQINLMFGFRSSPIYSPDNVALNMVAIILGGGRASTLSRILRYEKGLVYGVNAYNMDECDYGSWVVVTACKKRDLNQVVVAIANEIKRVVSGGVTPEELEFVQSKAIKSKRMQLQSSESWVGFHAASEMFLPERNWTVADYVREIAEVKLEDLQRVAKKYFKPDGWYLALCGDINEDEVVVEF